MIKKRKHYYEKVLIKEVGNQVMKTTCVVLVLLIWVFVNSAEIGYSGAARKIKVNKQKQITLVDAGEALCEIVVDEKASPTAKFAAEELRKYLVQSTGADIAVVNSPGKEKTAIVVGNGPLTIAAGIDVKKLPRDGFIIKSTGNSIFIAGRDDKRYSPVTKKQSWANYYERSTLFAVYDFLERFIGATFLFPGKIGTVIPKHVRLRVPEMDIYERPDNIVRTVSWTSGKWYDDKDVSFQKRLNHCRLRLQSTYIPNCHGLGRMAYIERFGEEHPEYFALKQNGIRSNVLSERMGGQLCFSSGIQEEIYKDAKAFLTGKTAKSRGMYHNRFKSYVWDKNAAMPGFFNVMPQDGAMPCQCDACKKLAATSENWQSDQVWKMTCDIANRLKKEKIKGYITQMAYGNHSKIPPFPIPDNVLVMVAVRGPWNITLPQSWNKQMEFVKSWTKKLNRKVWLWTYVCKYGGSNILNVPCSTPEAVGTFQKEIQPEIFGTYMETDVDYAIFDFLNWYVFSKVMWNKNIDAKKLMNDTYRIMFGQAADPMERFFKRIEYLWLKRVVGKTIMTSIGPTTVPPSEHELWDDIYGNEEMKRLDAFLVSAAKEASSDSMALKRVGFIKRNFYDILEKGRSKFHNLQNAAARLKTKVAKISDGEITIDGKPDEKAWSTVVPLYLSALNGGETKIQTEVRLLRDSKNLYVSYKCGEPKMSKSFYQKLPPNDPGVWKNSSVEIFLSPTGKHDQYYQWMINQGGCVTDLRVSRRDNGKCDFSWSSEAEAKTLNKEKEWNLELRIPLKNLGKINEKNIAANFTRTRILKGEGNYQRYHSWSPFVKRYNDSNYFGSLSFEDFKNGNMISNGTFHQPRKSRFFGKWVTAADSVLPKNKYISLDPTCFRFAGKSLKITNPGGLTINIVQYIDGIKPGRKYRLTAHIRTRIKNSERYGGVFLQFNDGANRSFPLPIIKTTTPWTVYSQVFTAHKNADSRKVKCYLRLYNNKCVGTAWFDGVSVEEISD